MEEKSWENERKFFHECTLRTSQIGWEKVDIKQLEKDFKNDIVKSRICVAGYVNWWNQINVRLKNQTIELTSLKSIEISRKKWI